MNPDLNENVRTWQHSRKGLITGRVIHRVDDWVDIELSKDQRLHYFSRDYGTFHLEGDVIRVRASFLREVQS